MLHATNNKNGLDRAGEIIHLEPMQSRVRDFMAVKGLSLSDMERKTGLARTTLVRACRNGEEGIDCCTLKTLRKIARALDLRPKDLFLDD